MFAFIIHLVVGYLKGEGLYAYLNKEWKREYLSQHGLHVMSPSVIRTVERYAWAISHGGYYTEVSHIPHVLKHRICTNNDECANGLADVYVFRGYIQYVLGYCIKYDDEPLLIYILRSRAIRTEALELASKLNKPAMLEVNIDEDETTYSIEFALNIASKMGHVSILEIFFREFDLDPYLVCKLLLAAIRAGKHQVVEYMMDQGVQCSVDLIIPAIRSKSVPLVHLFIIHDILTENEARLALMTAVRSRITPVVNCLLEHFTYSSECLNDARLLANIQETQDIADLITDASESDDE